MGGLPSAALQPDRDNGNNASQESRWRERAVSWTSLILASAVFLALYDLAKKASVRDNAVLPTLLISTCFGCVAYVAGVAICGRLGEATVMTRELLALSAIKCIIVGTSWVFTFRALRTLPMSIATVFAGYFVFSWAGRHEGIDFFRNRAVWYAFAGAACSALSSIWDKYLFQVRALPVESVQLAFQVGLVAFYAVALAASRLFHAEKVAFEWRRTIPLVGMLLAVADWLYFQGLACPDAPVSAASLLRRFSVVITFVLGARFFHETNLVRKGLALAAIVVGVVLICLGKG